ncbi:hypothetical protein AVEN_198176-1 [Araneus ventricosus]|uniref:Uncharacterized protein n=1 Tax=Araneus ventricosus TaxID=182803 RepID=A0A4Y2N6Y6_ARAVE|nr:hypothetical protein AVEN_198176-1 [Araneus ventricosus]
MTRKMPDLIPYSNLQTSGLHQREDFDHYVLFNEQEAPIYGRVLVRFSSLEPSGSKAVVLPLGRHVPPASVSLMASANHSLRLLVQGSS